MTWGDLKRHVARQGIGSDDELLLVYVDLVASSVATEDLRITNEGIGWIISNSSNAESADEFPTDYLP